MHADHLRFEHAERRVIEAKLGRQITTQIVDQCICASDDAAEDFLSGRRFEVERETFFIAAKSLEKQAIAIL